MSGKDNSKAYRFEKYEAPEVIEFNMLDALGECGPGSSPGGSFPYCSGAGNNAGSGCTAVGINAGTDCHNGTGAGASAGGCGAGNGPL